MTRLTPLPGRRAPAFTVALPLHGAFAADVASPLLRPQRRVFRHRAVSTTTMRASKSTNRPFASRVAGGALRLLIKSLCTTSDDLKVDIDASSNIALLTGNLNAVSVTTSRICFNGFSVSGGAALYTDEITIATTYPGTLLAAPPLLMKPFSVSIRAALTEADLNREGPVRDGLQALLRQIIATGLGGAVGRSLPPDIGGVTCVLDGVELSDARTERTAPRRGWSLKHPQDAGGKLILRAHATLSSGQVFRFAVRTGLCSVADGNIIKLNDPELIWRNLSIPMITIDTIGIKLEDTTKLTHVEIDKGKLSGDGIMVISPTSDTSRRIDVPKRTPAKARARSGRSERRSTVRKTGRQLPRGPMD